MKKSKKLIKMRQLHFDFLKKNNAVTDAKNGLLSLGAMKLLDVLLKTYDERRSPHLQVEIAAIREALSLEKNNNYVAVIKRYMLELKVPFELRNFKDSAGREVDSAIASFIGDIKFYKDTRHMVDIYISEAFLEFMIDKAGYTVIDLSLIKNFKTKFGYKIYEMYLRYYNTPHKKGMGIGVILKTLDELNDKFGTEYRYVSKMSVAIERGIKEIEKITGVKIHYFYEKSIKKFVFSWGKEVQKTVVIPKDRIDELVDWIIDKNYDKLENPSAYEAVIRRLIGEGGFVGLEKYYRSMLIDKYNLNSEQVEKMKRKDGTYMDFKIKE